VGRQAHVQAPPLQVAALLARPGQALSQPPQWSAFVLVSTHAAPQAVGVADGQTGGPSAVAPSFETTSEEAPSPGGACTSADPSASAWAPASWPGTTGLMEPHPAAAMSEIATKTRRRIGVRGFLLIRSAVPTCR
jgi:hypothetical protein